MRRAKSTLQNCDIVTAGGFQEWTAAESSLGSDVSCLRSTHDEADTRIILHARTLTTQGFQRIVVHSRDTDVLVLLVHFANQLSPEIWFRTGTAKQHTFVVVHKINIDQALSKTIPAFLALTGCDIVSHWCGIGKTTAWKIFQQHYSLLDGLRHVIVSDGTLADAEVFICRLYSGYETDTKINDVRFKLFKLFNQGSKDLEKLPPTQSSLQQHIKRGHRQCVVWHSSVVAQPDIPSPFGNGWYKDPSTGQTLPHLMTESHVLITF